MTERGGNTLSMSVQGEEVNELLIHWLGSLFVNIAGIDKKLTTLLASYSPAQYSLKELRDQLNRCLLLCIHRVTRGSLQVILDDQTYRLITTQALDDMTDDLMGLIFDKMAVSSSNYLRLHEYSMEVQSLSALKVLYLRFSSFYSSEEYQFLIHIIRSLYPENRYQSWLRKENLSGNI